MSFENYNNDIPNSLEIEINYNKIKIVDNFKYIGITFDVIIINKTKCLIFIFSRLDKIMHTKNQITIYELFHSIISYGITAWGMYTRIP